MWGRYSEERSDGLVSHPYLKHLKGHIRRIVESVAPISDGHTSLIPLCRTLEEIFDDGLLSSSTFFTGSHKRHFWQWIAELPFRFTSAKIPLSLQFSIAYVQKCQKLASDLGKGRFFLRVGLNKSVLVIVLNLLRENKNLLEEFYSADAFLADEILSEMLISLLQLVMTSKFSLNLKNCSFLDDSWDLPDYREYELVPCKELGIRILSVSGRLVVTNVANGSVADEDAKIEVGDIIDEMYRQSMRNSSARKFSKIFAAYEGAPVYIAVIKCISNGILYRPANPYLEGAGLCKNGLLASHKKRLRELGIERTDLAAVCSSSLGSGNFQQQSDRGPFQVKFLGRCDVGTIGTVDRIEGGVVEVVKKSKEKQDVIVTLGETELIVKCQKTDEIILQHGYPEIASCGRRIDFPLNCAYVAGDTTCNLSKHFFCYVFEALSDDQSKAVLQGIAQGFNRTHWAV